MRDYSQLLDAGTAAQLEKLKENEHKKGFDDIDIDYALQRIHAEWEELAEEVLTTDRSYSAIRREAADVANFAHMIILKCDQELEK